MTDDRVNRRTILKTTGAAAAAGVAGCLGGGGSGGDFVPAEAESFPVEGIEDTFNLWNWYDGLAGYAKDNMPQTYDGLERVTTTGYAASSEWYSKLQSGNHEIDAIASTATYTDQSLANDLIHPLPTDSMPNYEHALDLGKGQMEKHFSDDDGNVYSHPHAIGLWPALGYNDKEFDSQPDSWDVLWDPAYEGQITMQDQPIVSGFIAARYTGQDFTDPSDWKDIEEALLQQKELVNTYWKEYEAGMQMFINESVVAGAHTMGRLFSAHFNNDAPYVNYSIPKEGALYFLDNSVIPKDAPHPRVATEYLNWFLKPENAIKLFTTMGYLPAINNVGDAMADAGVSQEKQEFVSWSDEEQDRLIFWEPLDEDVREKYSDIWTKVKSA
ncbi:MAG: PotD/PotF family extracellular solute-binding protein [Halolamina sp.]